MCGIEGQAARLAAVENKIQNTALNPLIVDQSTLFKKNVQFPQTSSNVLSSTTLPNATQSNPIVHSSISTIPSLQNNQSLFTSGSHITNNISHNSSVSLDPSRIPKYDGQLSPLHPADFFG